MQFEIELDRAKLQDTITASEGAVDFSEGSFETTIRSGKMIGWLLSGDMCLEDYGFSEYDGDDICIENVELKGITSADQSISLRVVFDFEFADGELTEVSGYTDAFNALSSSLMLCFWTGEGTEQHPDTGTGLYWFSGEMNRVVVNGHTIHERR